MDNPPLNIELDADFQRKSWMIERGAWVAFAVFLVLAGLGLLGGTGPLARTTLGEGGMRVEYSRFARMQSPMLIEVFGFADADGSLRVRITDEYLRDLTIASVVPQPARSMHDADGVEFVFEAQSNSPASVLIRGKVDSPGVKHAKMLVNGESLSFRQFVYP